MMMKNISSILCLVIAIVFLGCADSQENNNNKRIKLERSAKDNYKPLSVAEYKVKREEFWQSISDTLNLKPGQIESLVDVDINSFNNLRQIREKTNKKKVSIKQHKEDKLYSEALIREIIGDKSFMTYQKLQMSKSKKNRKR